MLEACDVSNNDEFYCPQELELYGTKRTCDALCACTIQQQSDLPAS